MQYNAVDMKKLGSTFLVIWVLLISACVPGKETSGPELITPTPSEQIRTTTPTESSQPADNILRLWLAPAFDPDDGSPAGMLLRERLDAFKNSHSGVEVEIRIKEESGIGGLYQSLETATVAAPSVVPDLISLNPESLKTAALDGLIVPLEPLLETPTSPAWYDHTVTIARIEGNFYGRPIASETEILAYRTFLFQTPPMTWSNILAGPESFLFPANDPEASFSLAQYLALGGSLVDDAGDPALDPIVLTEVLTFYDSAWNSNILSKVALQYANAAETWEALVAERATSAVAPLDEFLLESDLRVYSAVPLPTQTEPGTGFAKTWSLAIVNNDTDHQELAAQMIDWLTEPEFLGPWTHALGMLPPTNLALSQWPEGPETSLASSLVTIMRPELPADTVAVFGPPIRDAITAVIRDGVKPSNAAVSAAQSVASGQSE